MQRRILLVEDDPKIRNTIELYLQREGYDVATADDGVRALEIASQVDPHLVVLDLMLPRLDGLQVCRALRERGDAAILYARRSIAALGSQWLELVSGEGVRYSLVNSSGPLIRSIPSRKCRVRNSVIPLAYH